MKGVGGMLTKLKKIVKTRGIRPNVYTRTNAVVILMFLLCVIMSSIVMVVPAAAQLSDPGSAPLPPNVPGGVGLARNIMEKLQEDGLSPDSMKEIVIDYGTDYVVGLNPYTAWIKYLDDSADYAADRLDFIYAKHQLDVYCDARDGKSTFFGSDISGQINVRNLYRQTGMDMTEGYGCKFMEAYVAQVVITNHYPYTESDITKAFATMELYYRMKKAQELAEEEKRREKEENPGGGGSDGPEDLDVYYMTNDVELNKWGDGTNVYYKPDGSRIFLRPNGKIEVVSPDGKVKAYRPLSEEYKGGGTIKFTYDDGSYVFLQEDGNFSWYSGSDLKEFFTLGEKEPQDPIADWRDERGYRTIKYPDGTIIIENPDGTCIKFNPDGSMETWKQKGIGDGSIDGPVPLFLNNISQNLEQYFKIKNLPTHNQESPDDNASYSTGISRTGDNYNSWLRMAAAKDNLSAISYLTYADPGWTHQQLDAYRQYVTDPETWYVARWGADYLAGNTKDFVAPYDPDIMEGGMEVEIDIDVDDISSFENPVVFQPLSVKDPVSLYQEQPSQFAAVSTLEQAKILEMAALPDVAVLRRGYYRPALGLIAEAGEPAALVSELTPLEELAQYKAMVLPTASISRLDESFRSKLEAYTLNGGIVISFTQPYGIDFTVLPGAQVNGLGYEEDTLCQFASAYFGEYHSLLAGQSSHLPNISVDGFFTSYPDDSTILFLRSRNLRPTAILYPYGQGQILATTHYGDWAFLGNQASGDDRTWMRDVLAWAKFGDVLEVGSGEDVSLPVKVTNDSSTTAVTIEYFVANPAGERVAALSPQSINLSSGESQELNISFAAPANESYGYHLIDYTLKDNEGNVLQNSFGKAAFVVSRYLPADNGFSLRGDTFTLGVKTDQETYTKGSEAIFTVTLKNDSDQEAYVDLFCCLPHHYYEATPRYNEDKYGSPSHPLKQEHVHLLQAGESIAVEFHINSIQLNDQLVVFAQSAGRVLARAYCPVYVQAVDPGEHFSCCLTKTDYDMGEALSLKIESDQAFTGLNLPFLAMVQHRLTGAKSYQSFTLQDISAVSPYLKDLFTGYSLEAGQYNFSLYAGKYLVCDADIDIARTLTISAVAKPVDPLTVICPGEKVKFEVVLNNSGSFPYEGYLYGRFSDYLPVQIHRVNNVVVNPGENITVPLNITMPEDFSTGQHLMEGCFVTSLGTFPWKTVYDVSAPVAPYLELNMPVGSFYAGSSLQVEVKNTGGGQAGSFNWELDLKDNGGTTVAGNSGTEAGLDSGESCSLELPLPADLASGNYSLEASVDDLAPQTSSIEIINQAQVDYEVNLTLSKTVYLITETDPVNFDASVVNKTYYDTVSNAYLVIVVEKYEDNDWTVVGASDYQIETLAPSQTFTVSDSFARNDGMDPPAPWDEGSYQMYGELVVMQIPGEPESLVTLGKSTEVSFEITVQGSSSQVLKKTKDIVAKTNSSVPGAGDLKILLLAPEQYEPGTSFDVPVQLSNRGGVQAGLQVILERAPLDSGDATTLLSQNIELADGAARSWNVEDVISGDQDWLYLLWILSEDDGSIITSASAVTRKGGFTQPTPLELADNGIGLTLLTPVPVNAMAGGTGTVTFRAANPATMPGLVRIQPLNENGIEAAEVQAVVPAGDIFDIPVEFSVPEDLPEGVMNYSFRSGAQLFEVPVNITGLNIAVGATLNRAWYTVGGDPIMLTLEVENNSGTAANLVARGEMDGNTYLQEFNLPVSGNALVTLTIPVTEAAPSAKLAFGVYYPSGRSIYLNDFYIPLYGEQIFLFADKQVYQMGDTAVVTARTGAGGTLYLKPPGHAWTGVPQDGISLAANSDYYINLLLPAELVAGTYPVRYVFQPEGDGEPVYGVVPLDVAGYCMHIRKAALDQAGYGNGDTAQLTLEVENKTAIDKDIQVFWHLLNSIDNVAASGSQSFAGPLLTGSREFTTTITLEGIGEGTFTLYYGIEADLVNHSPVVLVSGSREFVIEDNEPPNVTGTVPAGEALVPPGDLSLHFSFDEQIVRQTLEEGWSLTGPGGMVEGGFVWPAGHKVIYNPDGALTAGSYTLRLSGVSDLSGNIMPDFALSFNVGKSSDASLQMLALTPGDLTPVFQPGVYQYQLLVPPDATYIDILVLASHSQAKLIVNGTTQDGGRARRIDLQPGLNTIPIVVTAEDGTTKLTYNVNIPGAASNDATLGDLKVGGATVAGFSPATYTYNLQLPFGTVAGDTSTVVSAVPNNPGASLSITQAATLPGAAIVEVTAADGTTKLIYTVNMTVNNSYNFEDYRNNNLILSLNTGNKTFQLTTPAKTYASRKASNMKVIDLGLDKQAFKYDSPSKTWRINTNHLKLNPLLAAQVRNTRFKEKPAVLVLITHKDTDLSLDAVGIIGNADYCFAITTDKKIRKIYVLLDKMGLEK